jgi:hypothetical protein
MVEKRLIVFLRIFNSHLFTFLVGEAAEPVVVHAAAIAEQSNALDKLINGGMAESRGRSARISDVSKKDFVRFCQFAYSGDYSPAECLVQEGEILQRPETCNESAVSGKLYL